MYCGSEIIWFHDLNDDKWIPVNWPDLTYHRCIRKSSKH
jgi:hypothetical protein